MDSDDKTCGKCKHGNFYDNCKMCEALAQPPREHQGYERGTDMANRELLEAAAKAAGSPKGRHISLGGLLMANDLYWNPLLDDGDALRLAVKLGFRIDLQNCGATWVHDGDISESCGDDPYAATRRAIVRAAAAMNGGVK